MRGKVAQHPPDRRIADLAARQHGVVSVGQLRGAGLSQDQIDRRVRTRRLHRLHRGVYSVGHPLVSAHGRWLATVLACGDGAVLSHRSAGALWGMRPSAAASVDVTVPTRSGRLPRDGIALHRVPLHPSEATTCDGIPVTTPARTLLDLAAVLRGDALLRAIDEAERLRLFDLRAVEDVLRRNASRPGSRALAAALAGYREPPMTRSELERDFLRLCSEHDLPKPAVNTVVAGYEIDFLWTEQRVVVEVDGRDTHATRAAFERDRARDARLMVLGYRVVRFTYRQVIYEPGAVANVLEALLTRPRPLPGPGAGHGHAAPRR
jgi:very-short-patch-repair endonuclease